MAHPVVPVVPPWFGPAMQQALQPIVDKLGDVQADVKQVKLCYYCIICISEPFLAHKL